MVGRYPEIALPTQDLLYSYEFGPMLKKLESRGWLRRKSEPNLQGPTPVMGLAVPGRFGCVFPEGIPKVLRLPFGFPLESSKMGFPQNRLPFESIWVFMNSCCEHPLRTLGLTLC